MDVDRARVAVGGVAPDRAQQLLAVEGVAGPRHQLGQQLELAERDLHGLAVDGHAPQLTVQRDVADVEAALDDAAVGAPQHRPDPRAQLGEPERLGDVVVGAGLEPLDGVGLGVQRGQHDDRDHVAAVAQQPGHVVARRPLAQRDVEQHDVVGAVGGGAQRRVSVGHGGHVMALPLERAGEHVAQRLVVIDEQDVERRGGGHERERSVPGRAGRPGRRIGSPTPIRAVSGR